MGLGLFCIFDNRAANWPSGANQLRRRIRLAEYHGTPLNTAKTQAGNNCSPTENPCAGDKAANKTIAKNRRLGTASANSMPRYTEGGTRREIRLTARTVMIATDTHCKAPGTGLSRMNMNPIRGSRANNQCLFGHAVIRTYKTACNKAIVST